MKCSLLALLSLTGMVVNGLPQELDRTRRDTTKDVRVIKEPGQITSPQWPGPYEQELSIFYKLVAPLDMKVVLSVTALDTRKPNNKCDLHADTLRIFSGLRRKGSKRIALLCGDELPLERIEIPSNTALVIFSSRLHTDPAATNTGFTLDVDFLPIDGPPAPSDLDRLSAAQYSWFDGECGHSPYADAGENTAAQAPVNSRVQEFPWEVLLVYFNMSGRFLCGGAILNENWVLIPAHCTENLFGMGLELMLVYVGGNLWENTVKHTAERVVRHELFDVALLKVKEPITMTPGIMPICPPLGLPEDERVLRIVVAWDETDGNKAFTNALSEYRNFAQSDGGVSSSDPCSDDSAGAVVVKGQDGSFSLDGMVLSQDALCAGETASNVLSADEFAAWVDRIINGITVLS